MINNVIDIVTCILIVVAGITAVASIGCFWRLVLTAFFGNVESKRPMNIENKKVEIAENKNGK